MSVSGYREQADEKRDGVMLGILRAHYNRVWAWIQTTEDDSYLSRLESSLGLPPFPRICSLVRFREILRSGRVDYVGTRLHGGVFALQNGCRSLIISIDHRAQGFHETNNLPILDRRDVESGLERVINGALVTDIRIDRNAIAAFKSQFVGSNQ